MSYPYTEPKEATRGTAWFYDARRTVRLLAIMDLVSDDPAPLAGIFIMLTFQRKQMRRLYRRQSGAHGYSLAREASYRS